MSWTRVKLGDIAEFGNGLNFGKEAYSKGIKLIGVYNFRNRFYPDYKELEEVKEDTGEVVNIVSIIDDEKNVYSFQSKTFKRSLNDIAMICKDKPFTIIKTSGKTKVGRDFINCILDVSSIE